MSAEVQDVAEAGARAAYAIEAEGVSVAYGPKKVVRDVSMHVPHGSVYGLIGPSGAGKSTVMATLATARRPDAGTILVDGIDSSADAVAARGQIGYLPDFFGVYGDLTVTEYLDFYGSLYRIPLARRRQTGDELLELMELSVRRNDPVQSLSRGMKQKLGIARCLMHDPDILLLDEPASGMDPGSRLELRDILRELAGFGKAVLISSHLLFELAEVCSYLGVMRDGELVIEGAVDEIRSAVLPDAYLRVHLLDPSDAETAARLLTEYPCCREVDAVDISTLRAWFDGADEDLAAILGQLSRSGVRVAEFALERPTLEEVFLRMNAMEASEDVPWTPAAETHA